MGPPRQAGGSGGSSPRASIVNPGWLASSADRERAVGVLQAGFTEGRLTQDELNDRVAAAYAARTYEQLWGLTADLPAGGVPYPVGPVPPGAVLPVSAAPASWSPRPRWSSPRWSSSRWPR